MIWENKYLWKAHDNFIFDYVLKIYLLVDSVKKKMDWRWKVEIQHNAFLVQVEHKLFTKKCPWIGFFNSWKQGKHDFGELWKDYVGFILTWGWDRDESWHSLARQEVERMSPKQRSLHANEPLVGRPLPLFFPTSSKCHILLSFPRAFRINISKSSRKTHLLHSRKF